MEILRQTNLPVGWDDPVLHAAQAAAVLAQPGHVLLQATGGGHLLGLAVAGVPADILTLYVPTALRRQGRAYALLAAFLAQAQAVGASGLTLEVRADNAAALALYQAQGLTLRHRRVGYYGGVDALVLGRDFH
ncbi:MAG: GNAT family N-acetyltransferase [Alphaproteobacteria bacterium]|jgi:ribosomal-protein-alanine N-acetyltransferase|nr:GNAT family N-acetyltransferase [Alphaproteobacteria bacterium]